MLVVVWRTLDRHPRPPSDHESAHGRLRSAGYGERCPLDPGHNEAAWEQNRRVEFKILRTTTGPTAVEIACPAGQELIPDE